MSPAPVLEAHVGVRVGSLDLDVEMTVGDGEVVAVLGPNGAGKTTLLRALAGLRAIDHGRVVLDGRVLDDAAAATFVVPERRKVGYVFQDHLLFPHLTVLENVAFGLRAGGADRAAARATALGWLQRVGLGDRAGERPRHLSGGQAQRVALARALAVEPRLLLLDEPLAALDAATRAEVRRDLRRHLADVTGARLLVTHDPVDALLLADRLVILEEGRVVQVGTGPEVSARPRSSYVADLVGLNLLAGTVVDDVVRLRGGGALVASAAAGCRGDVHLAVRPRSIALHRARPEGSPRNVWEAVVADIDVEADRVRVRLAGAVPVVAEITPAGLAELGAAPGDRLWASVKAVDIETYET
ncbi:MAG: ATP-binding cassette domain-containing protein [Acidimicrobiales bacterium]